MQELIRKVAGETQETIRRACEHLESRIVEAAEAIIGCYRRDGGLLVFGNGGSAADAQHIVCELVGRLMFDRPPLRAQALTTNTSTLTCLINDYAPDSIFARQVAGIGRAGDVAIGLSTSGNSPNVVAALARAKELGMTTIAMTGDGGGQCAAHADILLDVPGATSTPRVQEAHMTIYHILCELVEVELFKEHKND